MHECSGKKSIAYAQEKLYHKPLQDLSPPVKIAAPVDFGNKIRIAVIQDETLTVGRILETWEHINEVLAS